LPALAAADRFAVVEVLTDRVCFRVLRAALTVFFLAPLLVAFRARPVPADLAVADRRVPRLAAALLRVLPWPDAFDLVRFAEDFRPPALRAGFLAIVGTPSRDSPVASRPRLTVRP